MAAAVAGLRQSFFGSAEAAKDGRHHFPGTAGGSAAPKAVWMPGRWAALSPSIYPTPDEGAFFTLWPLSIRKILIKD